VLLGTSKRLVAKVVTSPFGEDGDRFVERSPVSGSQRVSTRESNDLLLIILVELLETSETQVIDLITFWTALHDIGKLSAPFNARRTRAEAATSRQLRRARLRRRRRRPFAYPQTLDNPVAAISVPL
jgi:hypothetical protein